MKIVIRKPREKEFYLVENLHGKFCNEMHEQNPQHLKHKEVKDKFRAYLTQMQKYKNKLYVAEVNGNIVGYFFAIISKGNMFFRNPIVGEIGQVYILPEYRGKAVLKKAFKKLFKWFLRHDVSKIQVSAYISNTLAIEVYRHLGFQKAKVIMTLDL